MFVFFFFLYNSSFIYVRHVTVQDILRNSVGEFYEGNPC